jgi:hypothetical protein
MKFNEIGALNEANDRPRLDKLGAEISAVLS